MQIQKSMLQLPSSRTPMRRHWVNEMDSLFCIELDWLPLYLWLKEVKGHGALSYSDLIRHDLLTFHHMPLGNLPQAGVGLKR